MNENRTFVFVFIMLVAFAGLMSTFIVGQAEFALRLRLGKVINSEYEPGLHFKVPFLDQVRKFDARIQTVETKPENFLTSEKKNLIVSSFIKWRVKEVVPYYTSTKGDIRNAAQRLSEVIADKLRSEFGTRTIQEVVSGDRAKIAKILIEDVVSGAKELGIEIVDVRIKRIELPKSVSDSVYLRMEAERKEDAKDLRESGKAEAEYIRAKANRENIEVVAAAERNSLKIRGEADAQAAKIYADAYSADPEFYELYRSLTAYKNSLSQKQDILVIQPDSEFFKFFKQSSGAVGTKPHEAKTELISPPMLPMNTEPMNIEQPQELTNGSMVGNQ